MSISGISSYATYFSRPAIFSTSGDNAASADTPCAAAAKPGETGGVETVDFTRMTRKELIDWVNGKIKSGELSLDGTEGFVGMSLKIPVNGGPAGLDNSEQVDFMQFARDGMAWARQHNEADTLKSLQTALSTMQRYQGQVDRVDLMA